MIATTAMLSVTAFVFWAAYYMQKKYKKQRTKYIDDLRCGDTVQYYSKNHLVKIRVEKIDRQNKCIYSKHGKKIDFNRIMTI